MLRCQTCASRHLDSSQKENNGMDSVSRMERVACFLFCLVTQKSIHLSTVLRSAGLMSTIMLVWNGLESASVVTLHLLMNSLMRRTATWLALEI